LDQVTLPKAFLSETHACLGKGYELNALGEHEEATRIFFQIVSSEPLNWRGWHNLGVSLNHCNCVQEAILACNQALKIDPSLQFVRAHIGLMHLKIGDYLKGFDLYESRLKMLSPTVTIPDFSRLATNIDQLNGKQVLVYAEQGWGDLFQFIRFIKIVQQRAAKVSLFVHESIHDLIRLSFPDLELISHLTESELFEFDVYLPLMSIPKLLNIGLSSIPFSTNYLVAESFKVKSIRRKLSADRFKIGLCCQGSNAKHDQGRSLDFELIIKTLNEVEGIQIIPLMPDAPIKIKKSSRLLHLSDEILKDRDRFLTTAAIIKNCDLIITTDTAVAHLAGALGQPVWILLKTDADWRWLMNRSDSPWYPSARLFRQTERYDWTGVLNNLVSNLMDVTARYFHARKSKH
jgi:tetratricopeptide (TPR) repeat protein